MSDFESGEEYSGYIETAIEKSSTGEGFSKEITALLAEIGTSTQLLEFSDGFSHHSTSIERKFGIGTFQDTNNAVIKLLKDFQRS